MTLSERLAEISADVRGFGGGSLTLSAVQHVRDEFDRRQRLGLPAMTVPELLAIDWRPIDELRAENAALRAVVAELKAEIGHLEEEREGLLDSLGNYRSE